MPSASEHRLVALHTAQYRTPRFGDYSVIRAAQKSQARVRKTNSNVCDPCQRVREINLGAQEACRITMNAITETVDEDL